MGDYIERDALKEKFWGACKNCLSEDDIADLIDDMPAADVAPVVHGRWENGHPSEYIDDFVWDCSVCQHSNPDLSLYCPNCGAKMDSEG